MKKLISLLIITLAATNFGYSSDKKAVGSSPTAKISDTNPCPPQLQDSLELQKYIDHLIDSLKLEKPTNPKLNKEKRFYFNQSSDALKMKRFHIPPSNKHLNPNIKGDENTRKKPYIIHSPPDSMPIYVPEDVHIPSQKAKIKSKMPIKVPEGFENKEIPEQKK